MRLQTLKEDILAEQQLTMSKLVFIIDTIQMWIEKQDYKSIDQILELAITQEVTQEVKFTLLRSSKPIKLKLKNWKKLSTLCGYTNFYKTEKGN